jgi:molybdopterin biosynthesis enzyme
MLCLRQEPNNFKVKLKNSYVFKPQLTYFAQAKLMENTNERIVEVMPGNGSGDIANFAQIDGFIELPSESEIHDCNKLYTFYKI